MNRTHRCLTLACPAVIAAALCVAGGGTAVAARATAPTNSACSASAKHAVIQGRSVCLKAGQRCRAALGTAYRRVGFRCSGGRLVRVKPRVVDVSIYIRPEDRAQANVHVGDEVRYMVVVSNGGPGVARRVFVWPLGAAPFGSVAVPVLASTTAPQGCGAIYRGMWCALGDIGPGSWATAYITLRFVAPTDYWSTLWRALSGTRTFDPRDESSCCERGFFDSNTLNDLGFMDARVSP